MRFTNIDPPGTWCLNEALFEMLQSIEGRHFLEVGCGAGDVSFKLLKRGYHGVGLDFSPIGIKQASKKLMPFIEAGKYTLIEADVFNDPLLDNDFDIVASFFVMEHMQNDISFLQLLKSKVRPNGHILLSVPGRKDKWSIEDETAGHLRRYEREDIYRIFEKAGIPNPVIWSIGVPIANILFRLSNLTIEHSREKTKHNLSKKAQSKTSGVREIPFKTTFPSFFKIFLNPITLWPVFVTQRLFYHTHLGLTMLIKAQCT